MAEPRFPILFITATRIGDAVLSSGLLAKLVHEIPQARFTIAAGPLAAPLFRDTPGLDKLIPLEKEPNGLHWFKLWSEVRGRRWGLVLDMRGSGVSRFLRARRRAVRRPPPSGLAPVHKVVEAARLLKLEDEPPAPHLFTSSETDAKAARLVGKGEGPILAIAPAANWVGKTWAAENFAVTAADLLAPDGPMAGGRLMLLGGEQDRYAAEAVRRSIPSGRLIDLVGRTDLLTAYAALKHARLFIGNDSGTMHLAAAAGAPTLGLFGPSDDALYGPWGERAMALRTPRDFAHFKRIDPELNQAISHMRDLPVGWVAKAARELLARTAEPADSASAPEFETPLVAEGERSIDAEAPPEPSPEPQDG